MAEKIIKLNSKRANNYLRKLTKVEGGESMTYLLITEIIGNVVVKNTFNNKVSIVPFGGPIITEEEPLGDYIVSKIDYVNMKYVITLREKKQEDEILSDKSESILS